MNTLDDLLNQIVYHAQPPFGDHILTKGTFRILTSIGSYLNSDKYITENQATIIHKLFVNNRNVILERFPEAIDLILHPKWKHPFRVIKQVRNIFIEDNKIVVEFNFNQSIKTAINELAIDNVRFVQVSITRSETALTEKAVVKTLEKLSMHQFNMSPELKDYYNTIKSWNPNNSTNTFNITNLTDTNLLESLHNDVGELGLTDLLVKDRSLRYQYTTDIKLQNNTLSDIIASREKTKMWVDSKKYRMVELISSLIELNRLPILFTFDTTSHDKTLKNLSMVSESLSELGITKNIGIYFRIKNTGVGTQINQLIANYQYNSECNRDTLIAGIDSRKLPKFFLENSWQPMTVVAVNHVLRAGRTAVYSNSCDLVINYYFEEPLIIY